MSISKQSVTVFGCLFCLIAASGCAATSDQEQLTDGAPSEGAGVDDAESKLGKTKQGLSLIHTVRIQNGTGGKMTTSGPHLVVNSQETVFDIWYNDWEGTIHLCLPGTYAEEPRFFQGPGGGYRLATAVCLLPTGPWGIPYLEKIELESGTRGHWTYDWSTGQFSSLDWPGYPGKLTKNGDGVVVLSQDAGPASQWWFY